MPSTFAVSVTVIVTVLEFVVDIGRSSGRSWEGRCVLHPGKGRRVARVGQSWPLAWGPSFGLVPVGLLAPRGRVRGPGRRSGRSASPDRVSSEAGFGVVRSGGGRAYTLAGFPERET